MKMKTLVIFLLVTNVITFIGVFGVLAYANSVKNECAIKALGD